jgi:outer membrane protein OmpA-like peptidoglycan-associated protein
MKKYLTVLTLVSAVALTHCNNNSGGRKIAGPGYQQNLSQATDPNYWQRSRGNTAAAWPTDLISSLFGKKQAVVQETDNIDYPTIETVDLKQIPNWIELCKKHKGTPDTDRDNLPDACEDELYAKGDIQYSGLNKYVYNGLLMGARAFSETNRNLELTTPEEAMWENDVKTLGGLGSGVQSDLDLKITKKISVLKTMGNTDFAARKKMFYDYSEQPAIRINGRMASYKRSVLFSNPSGGYDDENIAIVKADHDEAIPQALNLDGKSVADITGAGVDSDTLRQKGNIMAVFSGHLAVPEEGLEATMGHLSDETSSIVYGTDIGKFLVLNDGETVLIQDNTIADKTGSFKGRRYAELHRTASCLSAAATFIWEAPSHEINGDNPMMAQNVFVRKKGTQKWIPLSQGMVSLMPMPEPGKEKDCYVAIKTGADTEFFNTSSGAANRVANVMDFSEFITPGQYDMAYMLDPKSTGDDIQAILGEILPRVSNMSSGELNRLQSKLSLIRADKANLPISEATGTTILDQVKQAISDQRATLSGTPPAAATTGTAGTTGAGAGATTTTATAPANPMEVELKDDGTVILTKDALLQLKKLGFTFKKADGTPLDPTTLADGETVKITEDELKDVLGKISEQLQNGKITPEQAEATHNFLKSLYAQKELEPIWGPMKDELSKALAEQLKKPIDEKKISFLESLAANRAPIMPKDASGKTFLEQWKANPTFATSAEHDAAVAEAGKQISDALKATDPHTVDELPVDQRMIIARGLRDNGFINEGQMMDLVIAITLIGKIKTADLPTIAETTIKDNGQDRIVLTVKSAKVFFESGSNVLKLNSQSSLRNIAAAIQIAKQQKGAKDIYIKIVAHTDSVGDKAKNMALSECRASAVKEFLSGNSAINKCTYKGGLSGTSPLSPDFILGDADKFSESAIVSVGRGSEEPILVNKKEDKEASRRVEIFFDTKPFEGQQAVTAAQ